MIIEELVKAVPSDRFSDQPAEAVGSGDSTSYDAPAPRHTSSRSSFRSSATRSEQVSGFG